MAIEVPPDVYPASLFIDLLAIAFERAGRPRVQATSWLRRTVLDEGAGVRSLHLKGLALDVKGSRSQTEPLRLAWLRLGLDALYSPSGVLHLELDGPALRRLGITFVG